MNGNSTFTEMVSDMVNSRTECCNCFEQHQVLYADHDIFDKPILYLNNLPDNYDKSVESEEIFESARRDEKYFIVRNIPDNLIVIAYDVDGELIHKAYFPTDHLRIKNTKLGSLLSEISWNGIMTVFYRESEHFVYAGKKYIDDGLTQSTSIASALYVRDSIYNLIAIPKCDSVI